MSGLVNSTVRCRNLLLMVYSCMYVCMYVCMYICMYVCMYAYVCVCVWKNVCIYYVGHPEPTDSTVKSSIHCLYKLHILHSKPTSILNTHVFTSYRIFLMKQLLTYFMMESDYFLRHRLNQRLAALPCSMIGKHE